MSIGRVDVEFQPLAERVALDRRLVECPDRAVTRDEGDRRAGLMGRRSGKG